MNWFELELTLEEDVWIGAKNAQVVVVWLLGFQKCCSTNKAHCCATSMVVKFVITIVFIITIKINVEAQSSTSNHQPPCLRISYPSFIFKLKIPSWNIIAYYHTYDWCLALFCRNKFFWKKIGSTLKFIILYIFIFFKNVYLIFWQVGWVVVVTW